MNTPEQVRDFLLPTLFDVFGQSNINAEIIAEGKHLIIKASKRGNEDSPLGFAITENSIKDGTYRFSFRPSCEFLKEIIDNGH